MPRLLTEAYINEPFKVDYKEDGGWVRVKPITLTQRNVLRMNAMQQAGHDNFIADDLYRKALLKHCIMDWYKMYDLAGQEVPYSTNVVDALYEYQPDFFNVLVLRILSVGQTGALDSEKN